jgi:hypothetical protein
MSDNRSSRPTRPSVSLRRRGAFAIAATARAAASLGAASPAFAKHGDGGGHGGGTDARTSTTCASGGVLTLKAKPDDATFEVEIELDSNVVGQAYDVTLAHNDAAAWSDTFTTAAPSGSFSVERQFDPAAAPTTAGGTGDDNGDDTGDDNGDDNGTSADDTGGTDDNGGATDDNPGADDTTTGGGTATGDDHPSGHEALRVRAASAAAASADAPKPAKHTFTVTATRQGAVACVATVEL